MWCTFKYCNMSGVLIFIFFLTFVCGTITRDGLYFKEYPANIKRKQGDSAYFKCKVSNDNGITYYWELNGKKLNNTTRRYMTDSDLWINRVDRERDSGEFKCIAVHQSGFSIASQTGKIEIDWLGDEALIHLQQPTDASLIQKGDEVILKCQIDGTGNIEIFWFRNGKLKEETDRMSVKKKKLHIRDVEPSDNGIYSCSGKKNEEQRNSTNTFTLAVAGDQTALIQVPPSNQIVRKGHTAWFDCSYQRTDMLEWYFGEAGPIKTNDKTRVHSNGTLQINDVTEQNEGLYNCVGILGESTELPQSYAAELRVAFIQDPTFEPNTTHKNSKVIIPVGSTFYITCLAPKSYPYAKKWWESPTSHTISDSGNPRVDDDGMLIIENATLDKSGKYKCIAENIAGRTEIYIDATVSQKPEMIVDPQSVTVNENEKSILWCEYKILDDLVFEMRWRKDGRVLPHTYHFNQSSQKYSENPNQYNSSLQINSTQLQDRGEYLCELYNQNHEIVLSKPATVSIIELLKFSPPPVNKKMELGSVSKIHCKAQGSPPPNIHWEKIGSRELDSHITDMNGTLHFNAVKAEDKGRYICIASNSQGIINVTINIDVVIAPKFSVLPKSPTEALEGQPVMIDCVVEGDPKPTIQWDKNLKMNDFDLTRFSVLKNGTLLISEVHKEDENKYGCTAGSSAGLNRKEVQLIVTSKEEIDADSTVTKAVLITMSVAGAYIILVVGLMVWCRYRRRSRKLPLSDATKTENGDLDHTELKDGTNGHIPGPSKPEQNSIDGHKEGQKSDGAETTNSQSSNQSKKSKTSYDKIALSRNNLKHIKLIGRGEFGDCMVAKLPKAATEKRTSQASTPSGTSDDKEVIVLIKSLTQTKDETCLAEFKREIDILSKLSHENVTKLYGLCREVEPHYMMLEYTDWGDLKKFLLATNKGSSPALTPIQSVAILHQLSRGMDHLSNARFVHRDLAARNCLVTSTLIAKIGFPRLTRDPYSQEYCKHVNQIIPLRWLPYEAVYEDEYSTKSDVYSFGVVIWEIFAQGELPFSKINDTSFLNKLKDKKLEWKAHSASPESLHSIQESCLDINPQDRPTFSQLSKDIGEILKSM